MHYLLQSDILWSYDFELAAKDAVAGIASMFSGALPIHDHMGELVLTNEMLTITGDFDAIIKLPDIEQLYLGFDEYYPRNYIRNFGMLCEPLRITFDAADGRSTMYLVLGYNGFQCVQTKQLFETLQVMLS
jgi:hypothetical protein